RKMAKRLIALHSRRKRKANRGMLDVRSTIRVNQEYDGLLFKTLWKRKKVDRPKVITLCDVSGSVANYARFFLMFLYSLTEVLPNIRSFAFSNNAGEVTDLFDTKDIETASAETLLLHGGGSTDYGNSISDLEGFIENDIDRKTTLIILGDGRSNYSDPRTDIMKALHEKSKRIIFLNPEPKSLWGTGDSEMNRYVPYCHKAKSCSSLVDLEKVVDDLLRYSF
ncbi:MAG: VWA domain-containing protein, partial [Pseudomonadota bacterium]|nr:VWA domain-containing protein [Pseudomonadota bacterium]